MANINNQGRWVAGQKSSKHPRTIPSAPPVKRERPGRAARFQPDENGFTVGDDVTQPGDVGPGIIVDIRTADEGDKSYGVRSPGGTITYFTAAELGA